MCVKQCAGHSDAAARRYSRGPLNTASEHHYRLFSVSCFVQTACLLASAAVTRGDTRSGWTGHRHGSPLRAADAMRLPLTPPHLDSRGPAGARGWWWRRELVELKARRVTWDENLSRGPRTRRQGQNVREEASAALEAATLSRTDAGSSLTQST
jgi:hypothetical protein